MENNLDNSNQIPENIRNILKQFSHHKNFTCLECGYVGLGGIVKQSTSVGSRLLWIFVPIGMLFFGFFIGPIGILTGLVIGAFLGILSATSSKTLIKCPSCLKIVTLKYGA